MKRPSKAYRIWAARAKRDNAILAKHREATAQQRMGSLVATAEGVAFVEAKHAVDVQQATAAAVRTSRVAVEEQVAGDYCAAGYVRTRYGQVPSANWAAYVATTQGDDR